MKGYTEDLRLHDAEFSGIEYDRVGCELRLALTHDPAGEAVLVVLSGVTGDFFLDGFWSVNRIDEIHYLRLSEHDPDLLLRQDPNLVKVGLDELRAEDGDKLLAVLSISNGMILYAICDRIEVRDAAGQVVHALGGERDGALKRTLRGRAKHR